jgi:hypothetical protein
VTHSTAQPKAYRCLAAPHALQSLDGISYCRSSISDSPPSTQNVASHHPPASYTPVFEPLAASDTLFLTVHRRFASASKPKEGRALSQTFKLRPFLSSLTDPDFARTYVCMLCYAARVLTLGITCQALQHPSPGLLGFLSPTSHAKTVTRRELVDGNPLPPTITSVVTSVELQTRTRAHLGVLADSRADLKPRRIDGSARPPRSCCPCDRGPSHGSAPKVASSEAVQRDSQPPVDTLLSVLIQVKPHLRQRGQEPLKAAEWSGQELPAK